MNDVKIKDKKIIGIGKEKKYGSEIANKKQILFSYNSYLYSYFFTIFFLVIIMNNKVNSYSEITIKVKGKGEQTVISGSKSYCLDNVCTTFNYVPNEIFINDELQDYQDVKVKGLTEEISTIKLVFYDEITNCVAMFNGLENIIEADLSKFDTSSVTNMYRMFCGCHSLTSINLSNVNTSQVVNMRSMFSECYNLKSLELKNFDTSLVTEMTYMFHQINFTLLDLYYFNFSKLEQYEHMFEGCKTQLTCCIDNEKIESRIKEEIFKSTSSVCPFTYDCSFTCNINSNTKIINEKDVCVENCYNEYSYKYEYKNVCYKGCPNNTYLSPYNDYKCLDELICLNYYNYEHNECIDNIPDGFYLNDSYARTIDKCNIECSKCSLESINNNYCISCNIESNYYHIFNDSGNPYSFVKCFNEIPEGYFLDNNNKYYKKCFEKCKSCNELGDDNNNKCSECFPGFILNNSNCYEVIAEKTAENINNLDTSSIIENHDHFETTLITEIPTQKRCTNEYKYQIVEKNECVKKCSEDSEYKYEYNNKCYKECPENTYLSSKTPYLCDKNCANDLPYENTNTNECIQECSAIEFLNSECTVRSNDMSIKDDIATKIKEDLTSGNLDEILNNLLEGDKEDLIIKDSDITYQITTTDNQNLKDYEDISVINLGDCEKRLRDAYDIDEDTPIIILKLDINKEGLSIPIVQYEAYDSETKQYLNLSVCNDTKISIILPASIDENEMYKYNSSNEYYNDICCTHTTESGTDIPISVRKSEFNNNNLSLCEVDCELNGYDSETKKVSCECNVKESSEKPSEIILNKKNLLNGFKDITSSINIKIIKCYKVVFTKDGLIKNSGSYIILIIILITILCLIMLLIRDFKILLDMISKIKRNLAGKKKKSNLSYKNNVDVFIKKNAPNKKSSKKSKSKNPIIYNIQPLIDIKNINITNKKKKKNDITKKNKIKKSKISIGNLTKKTNDKLNSVNIMLTEKNYEKLRKKEKKKRIENVKKKDLIKDYNDYELNILSYDDAIKYDKRTFLIYYISLLQRKISIIFAFYAKNDYNLRSIKICLFFFDFALNYSVNALFFTDDTMHKIYVDKGKFNFLFQLPQILYSSIISIGISTIIRTLSLSEKNIIIIKEGKKYIDRTITKVIKCLKIKFLLFFSFAFIFLILFWYYASCFCAIYKNTQLYLLKDIIISFSISLLYPIAVCLLPGIFRFASLRAKNHDKKIIYKISQILELI